VYYRARKAVLNQLAALLAYGAETTAP